MLRTKPFIYKGTVVRMSSDRKIIELSSKVSHHYDFGDPIIVLKLNDYEEILKRGGLYDLSLIHI